MNFLEIFLRTAEGVIRRSTLYQACLFEQQDHQRERFQTVSLSQFLIVLYYSILEPDGARADASFRKNASVRAIRQYYQRDVYRLDALLLVVKYGDRYQVFEQFHRLHPAHVYL